MNGQRVISDKSIMFVRGTSVAKVETRLSDKQQTSPFDRQCRVEILSQGDVWHSIRRPVDQDVIDLYIGMCACLDSVND